LQPGQPLQLYVGGGLNALRAHAGSTSGSDTGWDLLGGIETRLGYSHPYIEGKVLQHNGSTCRNALLRLTSVACPRRS